MGLAPAHLYHLLAWIVSCRLAAETWCPNGSTQRPLRAHQPEAVRWHLMADRAPRAICSLDSRPPCRRHTLTPCPSVSAGSGYLLDVLAQPRDLLARRLPSRRAGETLRSGRSALPVEPLSPHLRLSVAQRLLSPRLTDEWVDIRSEAFGRHHDPAALRVLTAVDRTPPLSSHDLDFA
jgi:hypothetical protein